MRLKGCFSPIIRPNALTRALVGAERKGFTREEGGGKNSSASSAPSRGLTRTTFSLVRRGGGGSVQKKGERGRVVHEKNLFLEA